MLTTVESAIAALMAVREPERVEVSLRFFKTGPGEYGEGDEFLGVRVPVLRKLSRDLREMPLHEVVRLLQSRYHEARLLALLAMVDQYRRGSEDTKGQIYEAYLANTASINNWDLVDSSAEHIVGAHLRAGDRKVLHRLASSKSIWERRIALLATLHFIRKDDYQETLALAELLLDDDEDLIHKAIGWMLREVGNRDREVLDRFLKRNYKKMPRTALRYAIEKHAAPERQRYLRGEV